jgi:hypothetical protein
VVKVPGGLPRAAVTLTTSGWIWGAGPVLLLPMGSNDLLTTDKWGAGPTAVVLKQSNGWTRGVLANHIWSFAGDDDRADVNANVSKLTRSGTQLVSLGGGVRYWADSPDSGA